MSTKQAELEARKYLATTVRQQKKAGRNVQSSGDEYERALKKATRSFEKLQQAVALNRRLTK